MPAPKDEPVWHTPGPWGIRRDTPTIVRDSLDGMIADCTTLGRSKMRDQANAQLIACAPMLKKVLIGISKMEIDYRQDTEWNMRQLQLLARRALQATPEPHE